MGIKHVGKLYSKQNYNEVKAMIYNPIFEEEKERKLQFKKLKKEIKTRARQENIQEVMTRVFHLLQKKPILTIVSLMHPIVNIFKTNKHEESIASKT